MFHGDPHSVSGLPEWYEPHISAWTERSTPRTSLWFWNTEVGWATVHTVLVQHGWQYIQLCIWDKGIAHCAGNVNSLTIRRFPVVTEVCALYVRQPTWSRSGTSMTTQDWLRSEWQRTGLPLSEANTACGVKNAATRKYLTADHLWYFPPGDVFARLSAYANEHGDPGGRPYFQLNDRPDDVGTAWDRLRAPWNHTHGLTNVWQVPALRSQERVRGADGKILHANQKPLELMRRILTATTGEGDVVWEPFGGLCTASAAALEMGRIPYAAEMDQAFFLAAQRRLLGYAESV